MDFRHQTRRQKQTTSSNSDTDSVHLYIYCSYRNDLFSHRVRYTMSYTGILKNIMLLYYYYIGSQTLFGNLHIIIVSRIVTPPLHRKNENKNKKPMKTRFENIPKVEMKVL